MRSGHKSVKLHGVDRAHVLQLARTMRSLVAAVLFTSFVTACDASDTDDGGAADLAGQDEKGDATAGIDVQARLRPGTVDVALTSALPRPGFVIFAGEGSKVTLEVTRAGTAAGLDTILKVYGPRLADGSYPKTLATDDDSGFGKLSKIKNLEISIPGFYLVELTTAATAPAAGSANARVKLSCDGTCDSELPIQPLGADLRWFQRAAERRALDLQAYAMATATLEAKAPASGNWGVIMDIDETTLDNGPYQRARAELGVGFSLASWRAWVDQRAAAAIPGAPAFTQRVHELGGKVVLVSNRKAATECPQTKENLEAVGVAFDAMLCQDGPSDKNPRFEAVKQGAAGLPALDVVMFVGDNIQDFPMLTQEIRTQPDSAFAAFGDAFVIVPNPMYGSWEKNTD